MEINSVGKMSLRKKLYLLILCKIKGTVLFPFTLPLNMNASQNAGLQLAGLPVELETSYQGPPQ